MDIIEVPYEETPKEKITLKTPIKKIEVREYEVPKVELSKNIKRFDNKPKVYTENPYSFNSVSLKRKVNIPPTVAASEMISDLTYNTIGKFLGLDVARDWNKNYTKVFAITEWAKSRSGEKDLNKLIKWIGDQSKKVPNVGAKNIDNLYLFARLYLNKK